MRCSLKKYKAIYARNICSLCKAHSDCDVHHINGNHGDNSLQNCIVVCRKCHSRIHLISRKQSMSLPEALEFYVCNRWYRLPTGIFHEWNQKEQPLLFSCAV